MSSDLVVVNREFPHLQATLLARFPNVRVCDNFDAPPDVAAQAVALLVNGHTRVDAAVLARFPNVRVVSNHGVGYDHIDVPACIARGVRVGNTPDVLTGATADMAFAILLAAARRVVAGDAIARAPSTAAFDSGWFGAEVHHATLGIVGCGKIGQAIARRGAGFDMRVLYHNRSRLAPADEAGATHCAALVDLLRESDFVVIAAPASAATRHLIGAPQLSAMKRSAFLVNISRGSLVDQDALVAALESGAIAGAALDVTEPEPLPRDHPLLRAPNCIITPHTGSATLQTRAAMLARALENLRAGLDGGAMASEVFA